MNVLAVSRFTHSTYNYTSEYGYEATGFSSDDDFCDDEEPRPPSVSCTRNWEICK